MDVALVTCQSMPQLHDDDRPLLPALRALGLAVEPVAWDAQGYDWTKVRAAVVRSAWDSHLRSGEFLSWAHRVAAVAPLHNPASVIQWNIHKSYLRRLGSQGLPITPTAWVGKGETLNLVKLAAERGWTRLVLKPAVAAGAFETYVLDLKTQANDAEERLRTLSTAGEVLVQPYLSTFETEGERSYIFLGGALSHVVQRPPTLLSAPRSFPSPVLVREPRKDEVALAHQVMEVAGRGLLYGRVDLATDNEGTSRLQEIELIEPSLFLSLDPSAPERFARAIRVRLDGRT